MICRYNFVDSVEDASDCDGHGTHVSATVAGRTVGVAKEAKIVALKVLDCQGTGMVSSVVAGLSWVAKNAARPAIVTLSLVCCSLHKECSPELAKFSLPD